MILAIVLALASPPVEDEPVSPCALAITDQKGSNTLELSIGSKACEEEDRAEDAAFLNVLAHIRAYADFYLLPPQDVLELAERSDFIAVFASNGEFVDEEIARDSERFVALLDRVQQSDLSIPDEYDPGWTIADDNKRAIYAEVIDGLRTDKLAMESYLAKLVRDEVYFAAYLERVAMLADLSANGAQLPERFGEVTKIMRERVDVLGDPPTQTAVTWRDIYKPSPDAPFSVLYRGFNGPAQGDAQLFRSPAEVQQSWVGAALSQEKLAQVLSAIDFEKEVLGLMAIGEMPNATANFFVTEFGPNDFDGHSISVRVGVVEEHCGIETSRSYPFVLVKAYSQTEGELNSSSRANYRDQCTPPMVGNPTSVVEPD